MMHHTASLHDIGRPLLTLILTGVLIMGTPGPSTISMTAVGAAYGFRRSLKYACGLVLGTMTVLFAVATGVVAVLLALPHGAFALLILSSAYLLYLAFKIATAPPLADLGRQAPTPAFLGGFLLAVANPKAYLAIAAVFSGTSVFAEDHALDALAKTALLSAMIVIIHLCWLLAGSALSRLLRDPGKSRMLNILMSASLVLATIAAALA